MDKTRAILACSTWTMLVSVRSSLGAGGWHPSGRRGSSPAGAVQAGSLEELSGSPQHVGLLSRGWQPTRSTPAAVPIAPRCSPRPSHGWKPSSSSSSCWINSPQPLSWDRLPSSRCLPRMPLSEDRLLLEIFFLDKAKIHGFCP